MKQTSVLVALLLLLLTLGGCQLGGGSLVPSEPGDDDRGQPRPGYGTLTGTVVDRVSGLGFWSGNVELAGQTASISEGTFQIEDIPVGTHTLTVEKQFFQSKQMQVMITGNTTVRVEMDPIHSAADLDLFARLVHAEARGEPYIGQVAVAASVLNRVRHRNYPNTLRGVITHRTGTYAQYSPLDDGSINLPASQHAKNAVRDALVGWDPSLGSTGFFAPAKVTNRSNWVWRQIPVIDIGNHRFFRAVLD